MCTLRAQRLKKFKILKISSEPPTKPKFWRLGLTISSKIEIFKRDWKFQARLFFFSTFGPLGYPIKNRWCSEFFTYVYVHWIRNSGPEAKECPKDPAVLKILRHSKITMHSEFTMTQWFTMATSLCGHRFPGNYRHPASQRRVCGVVNLGGVVKTLRHSNSLSRSVFSMAGSFGCACIFAVGMVHSPAP